MTDNVCNCACLARPSTCDANGNYIGPTNDDDATTKIVVESFGAIEGALKWADDLAKEFADTEGVNAILNFVKEKRP